MKGKILVLVAICALGSYMVMIPSQDLSARQIQATEAHILGSTIRLRFDYWLVKPDEKGYLFDSSIGHGTVKQGRFLVTHNHFGAPFAEHPGVDVGSVYTYVTVFDSAGNKLAALPASDILLVRREAETQILDFGERNGRGFFESLGLASAEFREVESSPLREDQKLAQINWDGVQTRVDWTTIQEIKRDGLVKKAVVTSELSQGSSGGGIFWHGYHVGNNWAVVYEYGANGTLLGHYSTVALNSQQVAAELAAESPGSCRR